MSTFPCLVPGAISLTSSTGRMVPVLGGYVDIDTTAEPDLAAEFQRVGQIGPVVVDRGPAALHRGFFRPKPRIAILGDSISDQNTVTGVNGPDVESARGYMVQAKAILGAQIAFDRSLEFGVSGETSGQIRARLPIVLASAPDALVLLAGTNDVSWPWTTTRDNIRTIVDECARRGIPVFVQTIFERTDDKWASSALTTAQIQYERDRVMRINRWIYAYAQLQAGLIPVNTTRALTDPLTGKIRTDVFADGLHPNALGAWLLGQALAAAIRPRLPVYDLAPFSVYDAWSADNPGGNLISNPLMLGTGGSVASASGFSGSVADGWTLARTRSSAAVDSGTVACSKVARDDGGIGYWQRAVASNLVRAASDGNEIYSFQQVLLLSTAKYAVGQRLKLVADYRLVSLSGPMHSCMVELRENNTPLGNFVGQGNGGSVGQNLQAGMYGRIESPPVTIRDGTGPSLLLNLSMGFDPRATAVSFTVDWGAVELRNVDA